MCLLFSTDSYQASSTLLIVSPLRTPASLPQAWQLVYVNNLLPKSPTSNGFGSNPDKRPDAFGFGFGFGAQPPPAPLMIVPLPNPHSLREEDFTLFPVSKSTAAKLRTHATALSNPYLPPAPTLSAVNLFGAAPGSTTFGSPHPPPLLIQQVGDYNISVAPSLSDLQTRAPWKRFSIPPATVSRLVADVSARYPRRYAFIIAEGVPGGVQQAGFAVQYRDATANAAFFPTAHEQPEYSSIVPQTTAIMDVTLIALGAVLRPLSILPPARYASLGAARPRHVLLGQQDPQSQVWCPAPGSVVLRADDSTCRGLHAKRWASVSALLNELPTDGGGQLHKGKLIEHETVRLVTSWHLDGAFPNGDVVARRATKEDVDVVDRVYADLGAWLHHREAIGNGERSDLFGTSVDGAKSEARTAKVDIVLGLLARQLADPGVNDRGSDVECPVTGQKNVCGPLAYVNLDLANVDLDEKAYAGKEGYARIVKDDRGRMVDTVGTSYVRVSARLGPVETLEMRTVQDIWKSEKSEGQK